MIEKTLHSDQLYHEQLQQEEDVTMSVMRSMNPCTRQHGLCGHEKMMLVMMVVASIGIGAAYWLVA